MELLQSKQTEVSFTWCPHPMTIDKSKDWGPNNIQEFPDGAFLKIDSATRDITHGVQPNKDKTAPVGWMQTAKELTFKGLFDKLPIWADIERVLYPSTTKDWVNRVSIDTLDGEIMYEIREPSVTVAQDNNGSPSKEDVWIMPLRELEENYIL